MFTQRVEEFKVDVAIHSKIIDLLGISFPGYPEGKTYYKQLPAFRYLVWQGENLVAHMAVDHRVMNNEGETVMVFGISDLCVHPSYQDKKVATQLINQLETLGKENSIDFIVLMAKDHQLYQNSGFETFDNECQWLLIDNNRSLGVINRKIRETLMVKDLKERKWKKGFVDFLGHIF